jgi:hypothetical protein
VPRDRRGRRREGERLVDHGRARDGVRARRVRPRGFGRERPVGGAAAADPRGRDPDPRRRGSAGRPRRRGLADRGHRASAPRRRRAQGPGWHRRTHPPIASRSRSGWGSRTSSVS